MPIGIEEWNMGRNAGGLKENILSFLMKEPDKAFSMKEIIEGTGYAVPVVLMNYSDTPEQEFRRVLERLMEEGYIQIRLIKKPLGEELYYKAVSVKTPKREAVEASVEEPLKMMVNTPP